MISFPANTSQYTTGRLGGSGTLKGIVLVPVYKSIEEILQDAKLCPVDPDAPGCFAGFNYVYDPVSGRVYRLTAASNTPYTFDQDIDACTIGDDTPLLVGEAGGVSPNATAVTVAVAAPVNTVRGLGNCETNGELSDAEQIKFRCALSEILTEAQVVTGGLDDTDFYVFGSDALNDKDLTDDADYGRILGTLLADILGQTCPATSATQPFAYPVNQVTGTWATPNATASLTLSAPAGNVQEQTIIKDVATTVVLYVGTAAHKGKKVTVKGKGTGSITVSRGSSAQSIEGSASDVLSGTDVAQTYEFDGSAAWIRI